MPDNLTRTELKELVRETVRTLLRSDDSTEKIIMGMVANGIVQFHKAVYTRRGFWKTDIKNQAT